MLTSVPVTAEVVYDTRSTDDEVKRGMGQIAGDVRVGVGRRHAMPGSVAVTWT